MQDCEGPSERRLKDFVTSVLTTSAMTLAGPWEVGPETLRGH